MSNFMGHNDDHVSMGLCINMVKRYKHIAIMKCIVVPAQPNSITSWASMRNISGRRCTYAYLICANIIYWTSIYTNCIRQLWYMHLPIVKAFCYLRHLIGIESRINYYIVMIWKWSA